MPTRNRFCVKHAMNRGELSCIDDHTLTRYEYNIYFNSHTIQCNVTLCRSSFQRWCAQHWLKLTWTNIYKNVWQPYKGWLPSKHVGLNFEIVLWNYESQTLNKLFENTSYSYMFVLQTSFLVCKNFHVHQRLFT